MLQRCALGQGSYAKLFRLRAYDACAQGRWLWAGIGAGRRRGEGSTQLRGRGEVGGARSWESCAGGGGRVCARARARSRDLRGRARGRGDAGREGARVLWLVGLRADPRAAGMAPQPPSPQLLLLAALAGLLGPSEVRRPALEQASA